MFRVTLFNEPIFVGPSQEWKRLVQRLPVTSAQKRVLLAHPGGFTNEAYRKLNQVDRDEAYRQIQELVDGGILASTGAHGRGAVYRIAPDLHRARAFLETRLARLRQHFQSGMELKNADYREMFGLSRYAAVRELRRLVDEGILRIEGERRGARYLPGPALAPRKE